LIRALLKDSIIYGLAEAGSRFAAVLLMPIYTRVFDPAQYGLLDLLTVTSTALVLLSGMQIDSGVARSYFEAKKIGRDKELVGTGLILYVLSIMSWGALSAVGFYTWFYGYGNVTWVHALPLLLILGPSQVLGLWLLLLRLERQRYSFALFSIGDIVTSALFSVLSVVIFQWDVLGVLWSLFTSKLLWALIGLKLLAGRFRIIWHGGYATEILTYGVPIVPSVLTRWGQNYANRFVLVAMLTMVEVGIFTVAVKVAMAVFLVDTAFRLAWTPYSLELMGKSGSKEKYARTLEFYLVGMLGVCAVVGALGWCMVKVLSADAYLPAGRLVGFIAMGFLWNGSFQILAIGINIVRKTYLGVVGFTIGGIVNVAGLWITVSQWGLMTGAITYLLGAITTALVTLIISQYHYRIPYRYPVIALVLVSSLLLPFVLYVMPEPTASPSMIAANSVMRLIAAGLLWLTVATLITRQEEKSKLLRAVAWIWKEEVARR
jgi:O-antigen/teichoic acid export membrane protein